MRIPVPPIYLECPDIEQMLRDFQTNINELEDSTRAHNLLLSQTQLDVYNQFDEKQDEWRPNRPYTKRKKERRGADMRIMHESKIQGERLRDEYAKTGQATRDEMTWYYPLSAKPYAKDLDKGVTESQFAHKESEFGAHDDSTLDREYGAIFNFNTGSFAELFHTPRAQRPRKTNAQKKAAKPRKPRKKRT